jgi:hypothetical protein
LKIATWNVNGIRARQAQVQEWIARERPDIVCLQELKAASDQVPEALCEMEGYWCYWHEAGGTPESDYTSAKTPPPNGPPSPILNSITRTGSSRSTSVPRSAT